MLISHLTNRALNFLQRLDALQRRYLKNLVWEPYLQQLSHKSVIILWATHAGANAFVRYGPDGHNNLAVEATSRRLETLNMQLHRVELTGLTPNTRYHYKIFVDDQELLPGQPLLFQTAPTPGSDLPFTFIAFGDFGNGSPSQKRLRNQMLQDSFSFILTTGDNSQGEGTYQQFDRAVFQIYRQMLKRVPIFPTLGNHDYVTQAAGPYLDIFDLPKNASAPADLKRYYSFDYANVHFVVLDSTPLVKAADGAAVGNHMLDWLRHDLSQTGQPWKIITCHHPPYNTGHYGGNKRIQTKLVPIFEAYGVDLVLSGHQHNYQRSQPLHQGQIIAAEKGGITYIVSGAGAGARHASNGADWLAYSISSVNHGLYKRITVKGNVMTIEAVDDTGKIRDAYTLSKDLAQNFHSL